MTLAMSFIFFASLVYGLYWLRDSAHRSYMSFDAHELDQIQGGIMDIQWERLVIALVIFFSTGAFIWL